MKEFFKKEVFPRFVMYLVLWLTFVIAASAVELCTGGSIPILHGSLTIAVIFVGITIGNTIGYFFLPPKPWKE